MSTASPRPNPSSAPSGDGTSELPKRRRRPRKLREASQRSESDGGVAILAPKSPENVNDATNGPSLERKKPQKLKSETTSSADTKEHREKAGSTGVQEEVEVLKNRLVEIEAQVQMLHSRLGSASLKSPRRRGRGRKVQDTRTTDDVQTLREDLDEANEELETLQEHVGEGRIDEQLAVASKLKRNVAQEDEPVALRGDFQIPLPPNLSMDDVRAIGTGVSAVASVARNMKAAYMSTERSVQVMEEGNKRVTIKRGKSWGEWFSGYGNSIAGFVSTVETASAVQVRPRPRKLKRAVSVPVTEPVIEELLS